MKELVFSAVTWHVYWYRFAFLLHCFTAVAFQGENGVWKITTTFKSLSWFYWAKTCQNQTDLCGRCDNLQMVGICTLILVLNHLIVFSFFSRSAVVINSNYHCIFLMFICHFNLLSNFLHLYLYFWQQTLQRLGCLKKPVFFTVARLNCKMPLALCFFIFTLFSITLCKAWVISSASCHTDESLRSVIFLKQDIVVHYNKAWQQQILFSVSVTHSYQFPLTATSVDWGRAWLRTNILCELSGHTSNWTLTDSAGSERVRKAAHLENSSSPWKVIQVQLSHFWSWLRALAQHDIIWQSFACPLVVQTPCVSCNCCVRAENKLH